MVYVLVKMNSDGILSVTTIPGLATDYAIPAADDVIRAELAAVDYAGDVEYTAANHPLEPDHRDGLIGVWVTDQEYWELWEAQR